MLYATLMFEEFEAGLLNQQINTQMKRQLIEGATTEAVKSLATTSALVAGSAAGSSAIVNTLISGSLAQLWGMINSMQILIHMSLFNVSFPSNASLVTSSVIMVATFDIPYVNVDDMFGEVVALPEEEQVLEETHETA